MSMLSPVLGFRPRRAGRLVVEKVPNPVMTTGSPFARQSWMASNTASTAATDSAFDKGGAARDVGHDIRFLQLSFPLKRNRGNIARAAAAITVSPASKRRHYTLGRWVRLTPRLMGLQAIYQTPRTTKPHPQRRVYPCLLKGLAIDRPNQVWTAYITHIPAQRGFLYLVAVMDWGHPSGALLATVQHPRCPVLHRRPHGSPGALHGPS